MASRTSHGYSLFQLDSRMQESPERGPLSRGKESSASFSPAGMDSKHLSLEEVNEAAEKRFQAAAWLQSMVGPLHLSAEPSEDEFCLCLRNGIVLCNLINRIQPGTLPKVVGNPSSLSEGAGSLDFQHSENVQHFLSYAEGIDLPLFDVLDLENGGLLVGSSAKVVDCILSLREYYEGQQRCVQGFRGAYKTCSLPKESLTRPHLVDTQGMWGLDSSRNMLDEPTFDVQSAQPSALLKSVEDVQKARSYSDSSVAWVEHICHKFVDTFMSKREHASHVSGFGIPDTKLPCEALLKLVMAVLDDKNPEEVAMLVEYMLKKVVEKFGRRPPQSMGLVFHKQRSDCLKQSKALKCDTDSFEGINTNHALRLETQSKEIKELKCSLEAIRVQCEKTQSAWAQEMEVLDGKLHGLAQAAGLYNKVVAENRELYNQVQELKGNIRVYCRVRPFLPGQNDITSTVDAIVDGASIVIVNPIRQGKEQRKVFSFNKVFGPAASQEEVFLDTQPLIRSVLDGFNVCIFAYGQTGSGKTYTMSGPMNSSYEDWGVNFRALHDLFEICKLRKNIMRYEVGVQMIEIYNEQVRDLLCMDGHNKKLEIRNSSQQNGLNVPDAKLLPVTSTGDVLELMVMGHRNRAVGATALNERSSRSHSVLTTHVKGVDLSNGCLLRGCLHLIDLAGSERVDKSEATGDRLKEAQHINRSLSALGDVIAALAQKSSHVPYRNSKLTQLLQDSLGGQAKALMFVHVSPDCDSHGETISTLKFAERVATVELGAAQSNKESGDVKDLKNQIAFLKEALAKKDAEVEFLQEEFRSRGFDVFQDRQKAGTLSSGSTAVTRHGNGNLPMVEMHKLKVRGSPERCIENENFPPVNLYGVTHEADEDSLKRRASEATSPESHSSSGSIFNACPLAAQRESIAGSKKNKIRHGSFDEFDSSLPGLLYGRHELHDVIDVSSATHLKQSNIEGVPHSLLLGASPMNSSSLTRDFKASPVGAFRPNVRETAESGDYLTEDDDIISDYSEVDSWHTTTDHDMSMATVGKQRKDGQKGLSGNQRLVKKPIGLSGQAMPHSSKNSLFGLPDEARRKGGKVISEFRVFAPKKPL